MANVTTNFLPSGGHRDWKLTKQPMIASVAIAEGAAVYAVGDGTHTKVTNATTNFKGIMSEAIVSTDADFATSLKLKAVWVPRNAAAKAKFAVGAGTFTTADVGKSVKFNDEVGLAVDTAGIQARIVSFTSSTVGECEFNQDIV